MAITYRLVKGTPLTNQEIDDNYSYLDGRIDGVDASVGDLSQDLTTHTGDSQTHGAPAGERIAHTGDLGTAAAQDDTRYAHRGNNLSDLGHAGTARTNLGLGNVQNVDQTNASNLTSGTVASARLPNAGATTKGAIKARLNGDILYITTDGTNP